MAESGIAESGSERLDIALGVRGLARSRNQAARMIAGGLVTVDGVPAGRASMRVRPDQVIEAEAPDHYVSRGAHKLNAALDVFPIPVMGRLALDVGASTGGFSQVLLERGARRVIALDVGHGQLNPIVGTDERVTVVEGFNARDLSPAGLAVFAGTGESPTLVVADLSFISLGMVLPALLACSGPSSDFVVLVKPQFEVGRTGIRGGIVRDAGARADAVMGVLWSAWDLGLPTAGVISSPLIGASGNREYLAWLNAAAGSNPTEWLAQVTKIT